MVSGYHALAKSDNAKLGRTIDYGLAVVIAGTAIWYLLVPTFWEVATSGKEIRDSFWLSWIPLVPIVSAAGLAGASGYYLLGGTPAWFSRKIRGLFLLGLVLVAVVILARVQTIRRFRDGQAAYLTRCGEYLRTCQQQQQALIPALSIHEQKLSEILGMPEVGSEIKTGVDDLRAQIQAELEILGNLQSGGREHAAEIESASAHDFRVRGLSPESYVESLANRRPGLELLGVQAGSDPLVRADALVLAASVAETAVASLQTRRPLGTE